MPLILLLLLFTLLPIASGIELSYEDFGVKSDGVRKRLAISWEADMEFTLAKKTVISEVERRISSNELSLSSKSEAPDLAQVVASSLGDLLTRRSKSVKELVDFVEDQSKEYSYNMLIEDVNITGMNGNFSVARNENFGEEVNTSFSAVHIPIDIYNGSIGILNDMTWSNNMDSVFDNNSYQDPSVNWQYFASKSGWLKQWPAKKCHRNPDLYDARMEPWYLQGLSAPKHLLILADTSGSTQGMILRLIKVAATSLINMLADWDRVYVATFSELAKPVQCAEKFLPATPLNKQYLAEAIANMKPKNQAQLEPALKFALNVFRDLINVSSVNFDSYQTCNKIVAILTDGDETFDPEDFVDEYRNMSIRIFVYGMGTTITGTDSLESLAAKTNGEYCEIKQMNAIRHAVQNAHVKLSSLSTTWETHPVLVATVSEDNMQQTSSFSLIESNEHMHSMSSMSHSTVNVNIVPPPILREGYQPSLAVAKPAFNRSSAEDNLPQQIVGVAGADIRTSELIFALNPVLYDPAAYAFIVAHNGYIFMHSRYTPRTVGPPNNKNPNIVAFTEVPIDVGHSEKAALPLISYHPDEGPVPVISDLKTSSLLFYGSKDYASVEKRWFAYSSVSNSSLGVVVSIREGGVDRLVPTERLPIDFSIEPIMGEPPYFVDLQRICAAADGIIAQQIEILLEAEQQLYAAAEPPPSNTSTTTPFVASGSAEGSGNLTDDKDDQSNFFSYDDEIGETQQSSSVPLTTTTTSTTTTTTATTVPPPDYTLLRQKAAIEFLQSYGNDQKLLDKHFCDMPALRQAGLDMILLRQLLRSLTSLQFYSPNSTAPPPRVQIDDDEISLDDLFVGEALAWAVVFPSGIHYSRPSNGLAAACVKDPLKLPVYQHAAYTRDKIFAQPAPCPEYSIVARSIHYHSLSLATVIVIYNSSSLLSNCTNCMLFDDGGFLLAATNKTVAKHIGYPLSILDASLYQLLVKDSNVYSVYRSRMLVRPCPDRNYNAGFTKESSAISSFLRSSIIHKLTSVSWWATLFSSFGRALADTAAQVTSASDYDQDEDMAVVSPVPDDYSTTEKPTFTEEPKQQSKDDGNREKCSRESLADDWGLPRKGKICAIQHPTLVPGPSFYISQLRPFACGHLCTRTAAWASVHGTNLLFVVSDPPCAGCNDKPAQKSDHLFTYDIDESFGTFCQAQATASVFEQTYMEQPKQVSWQCKPLVFPPPSMAISLHRLSFPWFNLLVLTAFVSIW